MVKSDYRSTANKAIYGAAFVMIVFAVLMALQPQELLPAPGQASLAACLAEKGYSSGVFDAGNIPQSVIDSCKLPIPPFRYEDRVGDLGFCEGIVLDRLNFESAGIYPPICECLSPEKATNLVYTQRECSCILDSTKEGCSDTLKDIKIQTPSIWEITLSESAVKELSILNIEAISKSTKLNCNSEGFCYGGDWTFQKARTFNNREVLEISYLSSKVNMVILRNAILGEVVLDNGPVIYQVYGKTKTREAIITEYKVDNRIIKGYNYLTETEKGWRWFGWFRPKRVRIPDRIEGKVSINLERMGGPKEFEGTFIAKKLSESNGKNLDIFRNEPLPPFKIPEDFKDEEVLVARR